MARKLGHEGLAKTHHFGVGLALRIEVCATLSATHRQAGQGVLENLLKAQELDNGQVHGRMETQAALVGTQRGIELNAEAAVHMQATLVVSPRHAELDLALRLNDTIDDGQVGVLGMTLDEGSDRQENLIDCLMKFGLCGVTALDRFEDGCQRRVKTRCIKGAHGSKFTIRLLAPS